MSNLRASFGFQFLVGLTGTVVGLPMGLVGLLFMPLVGAANGEYWAQKNQTCAAKVVISFVIMGMFLVALWV